MLFATEKSVAKRYLLITIDNCFSSDKDFGTVLEIQILCSSIANDKFSSNDNDLRTVLKIQIL
jgi:hypothetical protein